MKIERWAVVRKDGTVYSTYGSKDEAHISAGQIMGTAILLTGELPEPKKNVRLAHALLKDATGYKRSVYFYASEEEAKEQCLGFICWPAPVPDEGGFIEVEVES